MLKKLFINNKKNNSNKILKYQSILKISKLIQKNINL